MSNFNITLRKIRSVKKSEKIHIVEDTFLSTFVSFVRTQAMVNVLFRYFIFYISNANEKNTKLIEWCNNQCQYCIKCATVLTRQKRFVARFYPVCAPFCSLKGNKIYTLYIIYLIYHYHRHPLNCISLYSSNISRVPSRRFFARLILTAVNFNLSADFYMGFYDNDFRDHTQFCRRVLGGIARNNRNSLYTDRGRINICAERVNFNIIFSTIRLREPCSHVARLFCCGRKKSPMWHVVLHWCARASIL